MQEKELLAKIGERIVLLRTAKGMTQQEMAAKLDYEKSNMSRLESGRLNPRIATLYKVAQVLEVSLTDLLSVE